MSRWLKAAVVGCARFDLRRPAGSRVADRPAWGDSRSVREPLDVDGVDEDHGTDPGALGGELGRQLGPLSRQAARTGQPRAVDAVIDRREGARVSIASLGGGAVEPTGKRRSGQMKVRECATELASGSNQVSSSLSASRLESMAASRVGGRRLMAPSANRRRPTATSVFIRRALRARRQRRGYAVSTLTRLAEARTYRHVGRPAPVPDH
jgi:hypothetical protein